MPFIFSNNVTKGDLLRVNRGMYFHYGIASSDSTVIHFSAPSDDFSGDVEDIKIIETSLYKFVKDGQLEINLEYDSSFTRDEVVNRASSFLGRNTFLGNYYNILNNNCEHFARYIYYDKSISNQSNVGKKIVDVISSAIYNVASKNKK